MGAESRLPHCPPAGLGWLGSVSLGAQMHSGGRRGEVGRGVVEGRWGEGLGVRSRGRCFFSAVRVRWESKQRSAFAGLECGSGST